MLESKVAEYIRTKQTFTFERFENSVIFAVEWKAVNTPSKRPEKVLFYLDSEDLFIFCESKDCMQDISSLFREAFSNEKALYMFFVNLFQDDINYLGNLEIKITDVEDSAIINTKQDYFSKII